MDRLALVISLFLLLVPGYCSQVLPNSSPVRTHFNSTRETMEDYLNTQRRLLNYVFLEKDYQKEIPAIYGRARNENLHRNMSKTVNVTLMYGKILDLVRGFPAVFQFKNGLEGTGTDDKDHIGGYD